jgi:putative transposase
VAVLTEMYIDPQGQGDYRGAVRPRFSVSAISRITKRLDVELARFAARPLDEACPYLILDARYEKIREDGVIRSQAVLLALKIHREGRRQVLAVEIASRESRFSWRDFLLGLKARGLSGIEFVVADDHAGLRRAIEEVLPEAIYQRCYVHFVGNALDYMRLLAGAALPVRPARRRRGEADLAAWLQRWQATYPRLCDWVEAKIEPTLSCYRLPRQHHRHMKSTNMFERFNEEIRRRTRTVRIFPNLESCLRLVRALAVEMHEGWLQASRYLNMNLLRSTRRSRCASSTKLPNPQHHRPFLQNLRDRTAALRKLGNNNYVSV